MNFCFVSLQVGSKGLLKWTNLIAELVLAGFTKVQFRTHSLVELFGADPYLLLLRIMKVLIFSTMIYY